MGEGLNKQRLFVNRERSWLSHVDEQSIMPINLFNLFDAFWTDPSSLVWWSLIRWFGDPVIQWSLIQFFQETRAARNRFSDYFHCCGISLVRFLITTVLNIISSLHIVFSFCARTGWCDVWTEFTNSIKVEVDLNVHLCAIYCHWLTWGTGPTNIHTPTKRTLSA